MEGDCAMVGRQLKTPELALITDPVGATGRLQETVWAGSSGSAAVFVIVSVRPARIRKLVCALVIVGP